MKPIRQIVAMCLLALLLCGTALAAAPFTGAVAGGIFLRTAKLPDGTIDLSDPFGMDTIDRMQHELTFLAGEISRHGGFSVIGLMEKSAHGGSMEVWKQQAAQQYGLPQQDVLLILYAQETAECAILTGGAAAAHLTAQDAEELAAVFTDAAQTDEMQRLLAGMKALICRLFDGQPEKYDGAVGQILQEAAGGEAYLPLPAGIAADTMRSAFGIVQDLTLEPNLRHTLSRRLFGIYDASGVMAYAFNTADTAAMDGDVDALAQQILDDNSAPEKRLVVTYHPERGTAAVMAGEEALALLGEDGLRAVQSAFTPAGGETKEATLTRGVTGILLALSDSGAVQQDGLTEELRQLLQENGRETAQQLSWWPVAAAAVVIAALAVVLMALRRRKKS